VSDGGDDDSGGDDLGYLTLRREAWAELREKGSRFLAGLAPAADEAAAEAFLARLRGEHPDATHHCSAWRVGRRDGGPGAVLVERCSDDGEPGGTSGPPILDVLRGRQLEDVAAVVVRWFGGTKLGKGGLVRAYGGAARAAADTAAETRGILVRRVPRLALELTVPYDLLGAVMRLVHPPAVELAGERYAAGEVTVALSVRADQRNEVVARLADLGLGEVAAAALELPQDRKPCL